MNGPDFSQVDSLEKALALVGEGVLEPLLLRPIEFGGSETQENCLYVPVGFAALKHSHDMNVIGPLVQKGLVRQYAARPSYEGKSFVPNSIFVRAHDPRDVSFTLAIWGSALTEEGGFQDEEPGADEAKGQEPKPDEATSKPWWKFW